MKKINILILALLIISTNIACAQSKQTRDEFEVSNFTAIKSNIVGNIEIKQSSQTSVVAEGDEEILDLLEVKIENGTLVFKLSERGFKLFKNKKNMLTIFVNTPMLTKLESDGVGNIAVKGNFETPELTVISEGVGNIYADNMNIGSLKIDSEGVGNISFSGKAKSVEVKSEGVGNINTQNLITANATVKSEGVGNVSCFSSDYMKVDSEGVGNVTYYGNPKTTNLNKKGIGKIKPGD